MYTTQPSAATPASDTSSSSNADRNPEAGPSTFSDSNENSNLEAGPSTGQNATFPFDYTEADSADDVTSGSENGNGKRRRSNNKKGKETKFSGASPLKVPELESPDLSTKQPSPEVGAPFAEPYVVNPQYLTNTSTNGSNTIGTRSTVTHHVVNIPQRTGRRVVLSMDISNIVKWGALHGSTATITSFISVNDIGEPRPALTAGNATDTAVGDSAAAVMTPGFKTPEELMRLAPAERIRAIRVNEAISEAITKASNTKVANKKPAGFCDLPLELRNRIYKEAFVAGRPIDFQSRERFANSAQFLSTCKMVHEEGKPFLYGENVFHFERTHERRGSFFTHLWEEVGWKDIRFFLETIGPDNLALMKRISFVLSDSYPSSTPNLDPELRRFVHQATVHHCLNILGHHATNLEKVSMCISGRKILEVTDLNLIRALKSIKADLVHNSTRQRTTLQSNIRGGLLDNILKAMTKPTNMTAAKRLADVNRKYENHAVRMYCEVDRCIGCRS
jgi:hypothetical protein